MQAGSYCRRFAIPALLSFSLFYAAIFVPLQPVRGQIPPPVQDSPIQAHADGQVPDHHALPQAQVILHAASGKHTYRVEIARTPAQQARGLMFRRHMPRDQGMLFPLSPPRIATFWMKNTFIALDLIFLDAARRVINIARGVPHSRTILSSHEEASFVLELNAGEAERIGLKSGDRMALQEDAH